MRQIDERLLDSMLETLRDLASEVKRLSAVDAEQSAQTVAILKDIENTQRDIKAMKRHLRSLVKAERMRREREERAKGSRGVKEKIVFWVTDTGAKVFAGVLIPLVVWGAVKIWESLT